VSLRAIYDARGVPDTTKLADLYVVSSTLTSRPTLGNPKGRVLVSLSGTLHFTPDGEVDPHPLNLAVHDLADHYGAIMPGILGIEPNGYYTQGIDLTKRGLASELIPLWIEKAGPFDGIHWDIFTPLANPTPPWDRVMSGIASTIRLAGKLVLGQQFQITDGVMGTNGMWWEQSPNNNQYTMERHLIDATMFRQVVKMADKREAIFVCEMREPEEFPQWYRDQVKAWAIANDFYLSVGVDADAGAAL
jgi:hypothetical protein